MTPMHEFDVYDKETGVAYIVYDISYDKSGYPHLLIYKDGQWRRCSAKHFTPNAPEVPISEADIRAAFAGLL